ncbi:hypothetical protein [Micromonospora sp. ATCC 39149]|uniref:hypothetical protein n=1 Tax=Micromonospora sp. (strain ATCC 39149 / NRRL 15099 / SCC 1413) TaxID=219305 RepID=UPI001E4DC415|nr:hypothetical protein [Micromonospora sp. ATCC 39149]
MAYATDDNGSDAKIGNASRFDSNVSPNRSLRNGRPTSTRFNQFNTPWSQDPTTTLNR